MRISNQIILSFRRYLKSGKEFHDHRYKKFYEIFDKESEFYHKIATIRERPYVKNEHTKEMEKILQNDIRGFDDMHYNVFGLFDRGVTWNNNDYSIKADLFYRRKTQNLCQGTVSSISCINGHFP